MLNDLFSYFYNNFFRRPKPFCAKVRQRPASLQQIHALRAKFQSSLRMILPHFVSAPKRSPTPVAGAFISFLQRWSGVPLENKCRRRHLLPERRQAGARAASRSRDEFFLGRRFNDLKPS
jgi:hypothetical protein